MNCPTDCDLACAWFPGGCAVAVEEETEPVEGEPVGLWVAEAGNG